jgi:hypothetical protein
LPDISKPANRHPRCLQATPACLVKSGRLVIPVYCRHPEMTVTTRT